MADEAGSKEEGSHPKSNSLFKMPIAQMTPIVPRQGASAFLEKENEPAAVVPALVAKDDSQDEADASQMYSKETSEKGIRKGFSPAERLKESEIPVPYKEPLWGGITSDKYFFEAIKNGTVAETVDLSTKSNHIFGRLPSCDHTMDHPSLSRYHAVVQYRSVSTEGEPVGWYLYDLDSTHGTWINKQKIKPRVFTRLRVGYVVKFGGSSRLYILHGPDSDQDEESQLSVNELKEQRERQKKEAEVLRNVEMMEAQEAMRRKMAAEEDKGCSWGMDMDDEAEEDDEDNPFLLPEALNEELYIDDPKKSLRGFFEREGHDLPEYEITDEGRGKHRCRVELPIETASGEPEVVEVVQDGKKKDAVVACALEACRLLDRRGLLRQSTHESHARKKKNWEDVDFYDSDDDIFLDRTGTVEKKREMRTQQKRKSNKVDTYESLTVKLNEVSTEMESIEKQLDQDKANKQAAVDEGLDELDAFMISLKSGGLDTKTKIQLKHRLVELRQQKLRLERLLAVAEPCKILLAANPKEAKPNEIKPVMFGKMKGTNKQNILMQRNLPSQPSAMSLNNDIKEEEEEEEEEEETENKGGTSELTGQGMSYSVTSSDNPTKDKSMARDVDLTELQIGSCTKIEPNLDLNIQTEHKVNIEEDQAPVNSKISVSRKDTNISNLLEERKRRAEEQIKLQARPKQRKDKASKKCKVSPEYSYQEYDEDYSMWLPPSSQAGDGKTSLNEKFGY